MRLVSILIRTAGVLALLISVLQAQNRTVQGQLDVKPGPNPDRIQAVLELWRGNDVLRTVGVRPTKPYRFNGEVPMSSDEQNVTVYVLVEAPAEYVVWDESFQKEPDQILDITPRVRKRTDLYVTFTTLGGDHLESNKVASRKYFERALDLAQTISQIEQIQRQLARLDFDESGCESFSAAACNRDLALKSSRRLQDLFKTPEFLTLGRERLRSYWQERLDYLLWQTNYYSQVSPEDAFSGFVAAQPLYGKLWSAIVVDYGKSYPEQSLPGGNDPGAIKGQFLAIKGSLW